MPRNFNSDTRPIVHHHIVLKPHHKWILAGTSGLVILFMIALSVFTYTSFVRQELNQDLLEKKIDNLRTETQANINELSSSIIETNNELSSLSSDVGDINKEFSEIKASVSADFSEIIEDSVKAVVTIRTDSGQGTGFFITEDGYIVTNAHVLANENGNLATGIHAINYEGNSIALQFVGYSSKLDAALLKASGNFNFLELGISDEVQIGEKVIAIGNPLGLQFSVSQGIVSAVHRPGPNGINAYIQTDAALNPGNSGGPLINTEGEVVGINNFKIGSGESLGFALEADYIKQAVNAISQEELDQDLL